MTDTKTTCSTKNFEDEEDEDDYEEDYDAFVSGADRSFGKVSVRRRMRTKRTSTTWMRF